MRLLPNPNRRSAVRSLQWTRGLRTVLAVGVAISVCHLFGKPSGWAALGGLYVNLVDNGGPYRSRLANIVTMLLGGSLAVLIGVFAGINLPVEILVTFAFCFAATLARVVSQPLAASSVNILICYVVAVGGTTHTAEHAFSSMAYFTLGALWAGLLSLVLWPTDPFRPARLAIADVYAALAQLIQQLPATRDAEDVATYNEALAHLRLRLELAQQTLAASPARMPSRTVRARNLSVITESADLLMARLLRLDELTGEEAAQQRSAIVQWLLRAIEPIEPALRNEPYDRAVAFDHEGSLWIDLRRTLQPIAATLPDAPHLNAALEDTLFTLQVLYESIRAIWTGYEPHRPTKASPSAPQSPAPLFLSLPVLDTLRANLTRGSLRFRHALRLGAVVALDEFITHFVHIRGTQVTHGYWLAMTSLIVLQPYTGETVRKSTQRVGGTIAGAVIAALLAAAIPGEWGLIALISLGAGAAVAFYAVDYAWYSFFLTPTIVLMTLPHLHDWRFAAVRVSMTFLGALISVLAMLLLWPERESLQLPRLLSRGSSADAAYLEAVLRFWQQAGGLASAARIEAERTHLAPARRLCGLAANEAEETLDRALLEGSLPLNPSHDRTSRLNAAALTFTTYLRRLTQTITTIAAIGRADQATCDLLSSYSVRLKNVSQALATNETFSPTGNNDALKSTVLPSEQLRRIERQVSVLERTAAELSTL
ncbi:FUSC family protein [Granulicella paludicola]|uniref:FUSC family protein n=1 Tax=Granulicella paludicola TaxID=474951 RepID=UPI0021E032E8|nr:FUSC family protein [Granulicella paludicola]